MENKLVIEEHPLLQLAADQGEAELLILKARDEILPNLWQGCATLNPDPLFHYIVSCNSATFMNLQPHQSRIAKPFADDETRMPLPEFLYELADHVNECRAKGPTYVHCAMGLNRSGLIVGLALVRAGMQPKEAIDLLRVKRSPGVLKNKLFHDWLLTQGPKRA